MPTLVLNAISSAYPDINNRIQASIFLQSDPLAIIASIIDSTAGHPIRTWSFPGLPRENYGFTLDEIDDSDNPVDNLAYFDVVPGQLDGQTNRDDEQIQCDTTPGFTAGQNTFVMDGSRIGGGGTLSIPFQGNISASSAAFTLIGLPFLGDQVEVDWSTNPNDVDPPNDYTVTSTVLAGWNLSDLIADLLSQMVALDVNTITYTRTGNNGVRVRGFSFAEIAVTIFPAGGDPIVKPDYRGWEIVASELTGRGIMVKQFLDYSWDKVTGTLVLLQAGDVFSSGTWYNIHFNPITPVAGNSYPTVTDFKIRLITASGNLVGDDFGNKVIVEPDSYGYIELNFPSIITIPQGRKIMIEIGGRVSDSGQGFNFSVKFNPFGANVFNFLRGNLYGCPRESFSVYRFHRSFGFDEWRLCDVDANFKVLGQSVPDDMILSGIYNKHLCDGSQVTVQKYARIYNDYVLYLPIDQVVNFDDWNTGSNSRFYSLANSANPANAGLFHFPDRQGVFERNLDTGKAGDFFEDTFESHLHNNGIADDTGELFVYGVTSTDLPGSATKSIQSENNARNFQGITQEVGGDETAPKHIILNKYVYI